MQEISRRQAFNGRVFKVDLIETAFPDGHHKTYEMVVHRGAVVIVPLDAGGNIWFVSQYRMGSKSEMLELPAGSLEPDEPPEECAHREIREETGFAAEKWMNLGGFYAAPGYSSEYLHVFLASDLYHAPLQPDADEFIEIVKIPAAQAYAMAERGEIVDSKTLASLLLAKPHIVL
jgi:ADP-ribose pyrophosphatase